MNVQQPNQPLDAATIAGNIRPLYEAHPKARRKRLSVEELNTIIDDATDQNWHVQYTDEPAPHNVLAAGMIAIVLAMISFGLLLIPFIIFVVISPIKFKTTATLTIPTQNGPIQTTATATTSQKQGARASLLQAVQRFIDQNNATTGTKTMGARYQP